MREQYAGCHGNSKTNLCVGFHEGLLYVYTNTDRLNVDCYGRCKGAHASRKYHSPTPPDRGFRRLLRLDPEPEVQTDRPILLGCAKVNTPPDPQRRNFIQRQ